MGKYRKKAAESMEMKPKISIITVAYNSQNEIGDMIESVLKSCKKNTCELIISDNSPNSDTEAVVKKFQNQYKNILYFKNDDNVGFSKANNRGVKKSTGEYILFLNPDVVVSGNTIDGIVNFLESTPQVGAVTCAVFLPNGKLDDSCHRGFPTPWNSFSYFSGLSKVFPKWKIFSGYNMTYLDFSKTHEIDSLAGSFMMMKRSVGDLLHWWDEDYFFYGEDIDFCYRIKQAGYSIYFVPSFTALHHKGISSGIKKVSKDKSQATLDTKIWATNQRFKAMELFYNKHYKKTYPSVVTGLVFWAISLKRKRALSLINHETK